MISHRWRFLGSAVLILLAAVVVPTPAGAVHGTSDLSIRSVAQAEGDGATTFTFPIEVDAPLGFTDQEIRVAYRTVEGSATSQGDGSDFEAEQGEVVIPAGPVPSGEITITVHGDTVLEDHETFAVHLTEVTAGDAQIVDGEAVGTIWNDEPPELTISDGAGLESETITFALRLSHRTVDEVQVHVATRDGTATAGEDYEPFDGPVSIDAHALGRTLAVATVNDDAHEPDETFFLDLSAPVAATLGDDTGEGVIVADELTVEAGPDVAGESATVLSFGATASGGTRDYTFTWDFGDGTSPQTGQLVEHRYAGTGRFTVSLTVQDRGTGNTASDTATATITDSGQVDRDWGDDRVRTAIAVSAGNWDRSATALLATGYDFPDALVAGPLAQKLDAPLLLTNPNGLPQEVEDELDRLNAEKVIILGGPNAVPQSQADELAASGYVVERIAGTTRFGTAADIATRVGATSANEVTVALGRHSDPDRDEWPDALSAGSFASIDEPLPALLTHDQFVPDETLHALARLGIERILLLGGPVAIPDAVEAQLEAEGYTVQRVFGQDRYETSKEAAGIVMSRYPEGQVHPVFATGSKFPDGLTGGALAGKVTGPVLLVPQNSMDEAPGSREVRTFLRDNADRFDVGTVVGGTAVVSEDVRNQVRSDIDG